MELSFEQTYSDFSSSGAYKTDSQDGQELHKPSGTVLLDFEVPIDGMSLVNQFMILLV